MVGAGMEIRSNAAAEIDRFTNINDLARTAFHQIASRFGWDGIKYALDVFGNGSHQSILTCESPYGIF